MRMRLTVFVSALLLTACDRFYGVQSHATLSGPVDIGCVNAALRSVSDVGRVRYQRSEDRSTKTAMHVWVYGEGDSDVLQINQTPDGWDYRNARSRMGVAVPHDEMARFQPLMLEVNRAIQLRCGLPVANLKAEPVGETKRQEL
jgi:hypothetical protein